MTKLKKKLNVRRVRNQRVTKLISLNSKEEIPETKFVKKLRNNNCKKNKKI